jgi:hypothetical protein
MYRTEEEAAKILGRFETEHQLFSYRVRGISVWRILRFQAGITIQNLDLPTPSSIPRRELLMSVIRGFFDFFRLPRKSTYLAMTYASALRVKSADGYADMYFDTLLNSVPGGSKVSFLNAPGYANRFSEAAIRPVFDSTIIFVLSVILARLFPVKDDEGSFKRIAQLAQTSLELQEFSEEKIRKTFSAFWWRASLFEFILRRTSPTAVLVVDAGQYPVILACRRLGIRFIELQHGIYSPNHPDALPATALEGGTDCLLLPDYLALYGEYWANRLRCTAAYGNAALVLAGSATIETYRALRQAAFRPDASKLILTLTTQGLDRQSLIDFVRRFLADAPSALQLNIKLHPAYDTDGDVYMAAFGHDERVRILKGSENPNTYELIAHSDAHLSVSSACHFDAIGIGTPTIIIALGGYDLVRDLADAGVAAVVSKPEELLEIVVRRGWLPVTAEIADRYYRKGFINNLKDLIAP